MRGPWSGWLDVHTVPAGRRRTQWGGRHAEGRGSASRGAGFRTALAAAAVAVAGGLVPAVADARPPRTATFREHVGMAGVRVGVRVALDREAEPPRVTSGPMRAWGPVVWACFEGSMCMWRVPRGGNVGAEIRVTDDRLEAMWTTSRNWRTRRGVRVGASPAVAQRRYGGRLRRQRSCAIGGYGARADYLVLRARRRSTAFEIERGRIVAIWVLAHRVPRRSMC